MKGIEGSRKQLTTPVKYGNLSVESFWPWQPVSLSPRLKALDLISFFSQPNPPIPYLGKSGKSSIHNQDGGKKMSAWDFALSSEVRRIKKYRIFTEKHDEV